MGKVLHYRRVERPQPEPAETPDKSWTKDEIREYLDFEGIEYASSMTKSELLGLV